jgi:hypothetical protein
MTMRARKWLLGFVVAGAAAGTIAAGCGSSDNSSPAPVDSGSDHTTDTGMMMMPDVANETAAETGPEAAACMIDANIATLMVPDADIGDAGATLPGCYACIQSTCSMQLNTCNADCTCNVAVQTFAQCVASGTSLMICGTMLAGGGTNALNLLSCVAGGNVPQLGGSGPGCFAPCGAGGALDGGTDGGTEGGGEGGSDAAGEGGSDATGEASTDAGGQ